MAGGVGLSSVFLEQIFSDILCFLYFGFKSLHNFSLLLIQIEEELEWQLDVDFGWVPVLYEHLVELAVICEYASQVHLDRLNFQFVRRDAMVLSLCNLYALHY